VKIILRKSLAIIPHPYRQISPNVGLFGEKSKYSPKRDQRKTDFTLKWFDMSVCLPHTFPMPYWAVHFAFGAGLSVILIEGAPL
jgi:hypothetical protein